MHNGALRGFGAVAHKEMLHMRRDSFTLFLALFVPIIQMVILGAAIDTNVRQVHTVVYDQDNRQTSRALLDRFKNSDTYRIVKYVQSDAELTDAIVGGKAKVGIKIPVDYSDRLMRGETAQVLVLIDGSDSSVAGQAINVSTAVGLDESLRRTLPGGLALPVQMRPKLLFNPDSRSPNFFLPGLAAVLMLFVTTFLTSMAIVREKERGTLEQLFVTPVRPLGLLLGKLVPYLLFGFFALLMILALMVTVFRVPISGNVFLLLFLSVPFLFVNLSLGLLISSKANTQPEAMQMSMMIILPTIFFSGYIFPRETMPTVFYLFSYLVPGTYFVNIARGVILRGAEFRHLWVDGLALLMMGTALLLLATKRFRNKVIAA